MALKSELSWLYHEVPRREDERPYLNLGNGKRSQCTICWEVFSTESNFDRHRKGKHSERRFCVDPAATGLVRKANGDWAMPPRDETSPEGD